MRQAIKSACAYCGAAGDKLEKEHVIPRALYPPSKKRSRVQRITVPACSRCNRGWADDEAHFRSVLVLAGDPNNAVMELWNKTQRSLYHLDGAKRVRLLFEQMKPVIVDGQNRYEIYPGNDARVLRVVKKVVRGLSSFHGLESALPETRIWADVMRHEIPDNILAKLKWEHREEDVVRYGYSGEIEGVSSFWFLTFFERRHFLAAVHHTPDIAAAD